MLLPVPVPPPLLMIETALLFCVPLPLLLSLIERTLRLLVVHLVPLLHPVLLLIERALFLLVVHLVPLMHPVLLLIERTFLRVPLPPPPLLLLVLDLDGSHNCKNTEPADPP
jgi:hypothetical protein